MFIPHEIDCFETYAWETQFILGNTIFLGKYNLSWETQFILGNTIYLATAIFEENWT